MTENETNIKRNHNATELMVATAVVTTTAVVTYSVVATAVNRLNVTLKNRKANRQK